MALSSLLHPFVFLFRLVWRVLRLIGRGVGWVFQGLFGQVRWQAPRWLRALGAGGRRVYGWGRAKPWHALASLIGVALLGVGGGWAWQWYESRPKPVTVDFTVAAPALTQFVNDSWQIQPLRVSFAESVAPLEQIEKPVTQGVSLSPALPGEWRWVSERELSFTPKQDWPIDQQIKISLAKSGLTPDHVKLARYEDSFRTAPFQAAIQTSEFYQDPRDPQQKKMVVSFAFSHPVDPASFERRLSLERPAGLNFLGEPAQPLTVTYDKEKLHAYVHSAPLVVPREDRRLNLKVGKGVEAARGGNATSGPMTASVVAPGRGSLRFQGFQMLVVDNERFEPTQVLSFESTNPVSEQAMVSSVKAWLLPEFPDNYDGPRDRPYSWVGQEVSDRLLAKSEPLTLSYQPGELEYNQRHNFNFKAPVGRAVYVLVREGVQAFGGYEAIKPTAYAFQVQPYPTLLKLMSKGALLTSAGEKKVAYVSRGVEAVRYEVGRLLPNQLHHMLDGVGYLATPYLGDSLFDKLVERSSQVQELEGDDPTRVHLQSIDLGRHLAGRDGARRGIFVLRLRPAKRGEDPSKANEFAYGESDGRLVVITDLGVIAKRANSGDYDLYVMSIAGGVPVEGARVALVGVNGEAVASANTDAAGHAAIAMQERWVREKRPLMFVITKGDDTSFLPINHYDRVLDYSRFDVGGVDNASSGQQLSAYAFTDRKLYRPGETAHLMFMVRTADWRGALAGLPVEVDVLDPRGLLVQRTRLALGTAGFEGVDFASRDASPTGQYQVNVNLIRPHDQREHLGGTTFTVREFEPDRLKVRATLAEKPVEGWLKPEEVAAKISVMHLFGNPAGGARVEGDLSLTGGIGGFARYPDYQFRDPAKPLEAAVRETLEAVETDDQGEATLNLNLARFDRASYRVHVLARAFEPGSGRSVNAQASALVSSAPYLVGVKADGDLGYVSRGGARHAHWIAVDPSLKQVAAEGLKLEWIERRHISVLAQQGDGTWRYVSRPKESVKESKAVTLAADGLKLALATGTPGDFAYVLRNKDGEVVSRLDYSVAGAANLSRSLERNAELQLKLASTEVSPGQSLEISVIAPYTGAGLITIERDKVLAHKWFRADTTSSVQRIEVPRDLEGTAYVNVQFVRDIGSDEVFMSPMSYGVLPFTVNLEARRQPASLSAPARVKPGETVNIRLDTEAGVRAAVVAVDEGILQVARFTNPDPLGHFFQKPRLQVGTSQILDLILPEFARLAASAAPGGDGEDLLKQHLNPFKKKRQPPVVYFSGVRDVAAGGETFAYTVPDSFNGKLRIYTVIATAGQVGVYETGTEVQGDLILTPNVPMAAAPGDELVVTVGVYNNQKGKGRQPVTVRAVTDKGLKVLGEPKLTLTLDEGAEQVAEFRVQLTDVLGSAGLRFEAESGSAKAKIAESISVRPAVPYRTVLNAGSFDADSAKVALSRDLFPEYREVEAGLAASPLVWAQGLRAYLSHYPYSCTEQITSQAIPALVIKRYPTLGTVDGAEVASVLRVLRSRQNDTGGFGLWAGNPVAEDYVSLHVTQFLIEAKDRGEAVPEDMLRQALSYVQHISGQPSEGLAGARERAYGIYLLARQGINPAAQLSSLRADLDEIYRKEWPRDLTAAYLAATYRLLRQDDVANRLIKDVPWRTPGKWVGGDSVYYDPLVHDAVLLHLTARHFPERLDKLPGNLLNALGQMLVDQRFHSLSAGQLLLALDAYHTAVRGQVGTLAMAEADAAGKRKPLPLEAGSLARVPLSLQARQLLLSRSGEGQAFYVLSEAGFDRKIPAAASHGLELQREFVDAGGKALTEVQVGDEFFVRLRIRGTAGDSLSQVAIVDLLPGGLEPVPVVPEADAPASSQEEYSEEEGEGDYEDEAEQPAYQSPLGVTADRGWQLQSVDVRDDRVVLYGNLEGRDVITLRYPVRAVNAGVFQVPAPYAEGMYDRAVYGFGASGRLSVVKPAAP